MALESQPGLRKDVGRGYQDRQRSSSWNQKMVRTQEVLEASPTRYIPDLNGPLPGNIQQGLDPCSPLFSPATDSVSRNVLSESGSGDILPKPLRRNLEDMCITWVQTESQNQRVISPSDAPSPLTRCCAQSRQLSDASTLLRLYQERWALFPGFRQLMQWGL